MLKAPVINPVAMRHLLEVLADKGHAHHSVCRGMGITSHQIDEPDFQLSARQVSTLVSRARHLMPSGCLGHMVGRRRTMVSSGLLGLGVATCESVHQALALIAEQPHALGTALCLSAVTSADGSLRLRASCDLGDPHLAVFLLEECFTALTQLMRDVVGSDFGPQIVHLPHAGASHDLSLIAYFRAPVLFNQMAADLVFSPAMLREPIATADAVVHAQMREMLAVHGSSRVQSDLCSTIERMLAAELHSPPKLPAVASALSMSVRTLRRKLAEQNTTFQSISDRVCQREALGLLGSDVSTVSEVAQALGFADVRSFRRAFKRWTGSVPSAARRSLG